MSRALLRWSEMAGESTRMRVVMSRAAKRLQDRDVASAFLSWRSKTQDKNALFLIGAKVVLRWNRLSLSVPFSQWTDLIAEKHAEHQDKAVAVEAERRIEMCKRVVKKMLRHVPSNDHCGRIPHGSF